MESRRKTRRKIPKFAYGAKTLTVPGELLNLCDEEDEETVQNWFCDVAEDHGKLFLICSSKCSDLYIEKRTTGVWTFECGGGLKEWRHIGCVRRHFERQGYTMVTMDDTTGVDEHRGKAMYFFGGDFVFSSGYELRRMNDMWKFRISPNGSSHEFTEVFVQQPAKGFLRARTCHTAAVTTSQTMLIYGGRGKEDDPLGDIWQLAVDRDTIQNRDRAVCRQLIPAGPSPGRRDGHISAIWDKWFFVFSGTISVSDHRNIADKIWRMKIPLCTLQSSRCDPVECESCFVNAIGQCPKHMPDSSLGGVVFEDRWVLVGNSGDGRAVFEFCFSNNTWTTIENVMPVEVPRVCRPFSIRTVLLDQAPSNENRSQSSLSPTLRSATIFVMFGFESFPQVVLLRCQELPPALLIDPLRCQLHDDEFSQMQDELRYCKSQFEDDLCQSEYKLKYEWTRPINKHNEFSQLLCQLRDELSHCKSQLRAVESEASELREKNRELTEGNRELTERNRELTEGNGKLTEENRGLTEGIRKLTEGICKLTEGIRKLTEENRELTEGNRELTEGNGKLTEENRKLTEHNESMKEDTDNYKLLRSHPITGDGVRNLLRKIQEDKDKKCIICQTVDVQVAFNPCGHMCCCEGCANTLLQQRNSTCPMCRQRVKNILRVHIS